MPFTTALGDLIIGLSCALLTSFIAAFGLNLQGAAGVKIDAIKLEDDIQDEFDEYEVQMTSRTIKVEKKYMSCCWNWSPKAQRIVGVIIYLLAQPGNAIGLVFAGPMILAPLGSAATLVFNALFARMLLGSRLTTQAAWGTALLVVGGIFCGLFIALASTDIGPSEESPLTHPLFLGWFGAQSIIVVCLICLARFIEVTRVGLQSTQDTQSVKQSGLFKWAKRISVSSVKVAKYLSRPFVWLGKRISVALTQTKESLFPGRIVLEASPVQPDKEVSPNIGLRTTSSGVWSVFQDLNIEVVEEQTDEEALLSPERPESPIQSPKLVSPVLSEHSPSDFRGPAGVLYAMAGGISASMAAAIAKVTFDAIAMSTGWDGMKQHPAPLIALPILVTFVIINLACLSKGLGLAGALLIVPVHMAAYIAPQLPDEAVIRGSSGKAGIAGGFLAGVIIGVVLICAGVGILGASNISAEKDIPLETSEDV
jgi:hypothetical protein